MRISLFFLLVVLGCSRATPVQEIHVDPTATTDDVQPFVARDTDWPSWRGPRGNGISDSASAPITWSETKNVEWKALIPGRGHASPVVCGPHVYLATALEDEQKQLVMAFDRETGAEQWRTLVHAGGFPSDRKMHPKGTHANGTVACDDQFVFTAFLNNDSIVASAVDLDGKLVWQTTLGAFNSKFGYAPSPLVYRSLVIFAADNQGGGYLAAVHRRTGEIAWRKARSRSSTYSSPIVASVAGKDQLLISGGYEVCSYDPGSGELLWSREGTTDATCGTMVWNDTMVFAGGGYPDKQVLGVLADGSGQVVWSSPVQVYEPSLLAAGNELFAVTDNGIAHCWDSKTGKLHWKRRLGGSFSSSPVFCDGRVYVSNASGTTFVFRAAADGYEELARNQLGDDAFATLAICGGRIYARVGSRQSGKRQEMLYCIGGDVDSQEGKKS